MRVRVRHQVAGLSIAVVAAATLAGPGWAARPDDKEGMLGVGAIGAASFEKSTRPDDRGTAHGAGLVALEQVASSGPATRPDDRAEPRGPGAVGRAPVTTIAIVESDGLPWGEIGVGAALFAIVGLLGMALVFNGRYQRHPA